MAHKPGEKKTKQHQAMNGVASKHNSDNKSLSTSLKGGLSKTPQSSKSAIGRKAKSASKAKIKAPKKPKLLVKPIWTRVGTALSLAEAEERINIREFALRFSSVLELSRSHLDELDEIRPSRTRSLEDEEEDLVPWVSEACIKSLVVGLLNMLDAKGEREKVSPTCMHVQHLRSSSNL